MLRIDSPYGRLYKVSGNGLILPSVTTVGKATAKKPFNRTVWSRKLTTKGLSEYEALLFAEYFLEKGLTEGLARAIAEEYIHSPMDTDVAEVYMDWKSAHSSRRGTLLHEFLEQILPVDTVIHWKSCPVSENPETQALVHSLWDGEILQQIKRVRSLEERLWWYSNGIGYAGTEDICYETWDGLLLSGDWKTKDPKDYCPTQYGHEYEIQLIAYAAAKAARRSMVVDGLHVNYAFSNGSPGVQSVIDSSGLKPLWTEWVMRLKAWWATIGVNALMERNA